MARSRWFMMPPAYTPEPEKASIDVPTVLRDNVKSAADTSAELRQIRLQVGELLEKMERLIVVSAELRDKAKPADATR